MSNAVLSKSRPRFQGFVVGVKTVMDCLKRTLADRVPILRWAPHYNMEKFVSDLVAGVTVGLTVMPQALAYATLAGLEPQYGLYSAFMGCFIYTIFGTCKDITIGPTALMALMTYQQVIGRNTDYAVLLCFSTGIVQFVMGLLRLGVLVDFISVPVTVGFTSATAVIIMTSQLKGLFGLKISASGFLDTMTKVLNDLPNTRYQDFLMGIISVILLMLFRKLKDIKLKKIGIRRTLWLISTSRNAIIVIVCSLIAYFYEISGVGSPFTLTGTVRPGLPEFKIPPFQTDLQNRTVTFTDMMSDLGTSIILVPVIGVLGNVAIGKAFGDDQMFDATQELVTLSLCNILGSFFSSMPITGSFSRSAVNHASGVQTPLGGIYTGVMVVLALSFLTPYFAFIPKPSLAAVIISAVMFMIEFEVIKPMWKSSRKDLFATCVTFVLCLLIGVEYGIIAGVVINVGFLLHPSARPKIFVETAKTSLQGVEYLIITPGNSLYFPAADFIKTTIRKMALTPSIPIVVDCHYVLGTDFTAAKAIAVLSKEITSRQQSLYFLQTRENVQSVFRSVFDATFVATKEQLEHLLEETPAKGDPTDDVSLLWSFEKK